MHYKNTNMFDWESEEEKIRRWISVSAFEKLTTLRRINEFFDRALSRETKLIRRQLREG